MIVQDSYIGHASKSVTLAIGGTRCRLIAIRSPARSSTSNETTLTVGVRDALEVTVYLISANIKVLSRYVRIAAFVGDL